MPERSSSARRMIWASRMPLAMAIRRQGLPARGALAGQQAEAAELGVQIVADRVGVGQRDAVRDKRRNARDRRGRREVGGKRGDGLRAPAMRPFRLHEVEAVGDPQFEDRHPDPPDPRRGGRHEQAHRSLGLARPRGGVAQVGEGGLHAAGLVRHLGEAEGHLDAAQRAHQHQVVEVAEMADAEDLAGDLGQALAERHVEVLQRHLAEGVGVVALGHDDRGERAGIGLGIAAQDLEAPGVHGACASLRRGGRGARRPCSRPSSSSMSQASLRP